MFVKTSTNIYETTGETEKCYFVKCKRYDTERLLSKREVIVEPVVDLSCLIEEYIIYEGCKYRVAMSRDEAEHTLNNPEAVVYGAIWVFGNGAPHLKTVSKYIDKELVLL